MPKLGMHRTEIRLLKNYDGSDARQVPAIGATITVYRQSGIVAGPGGIEFVGAQDTEQVPLAQTGRFAVGDYVRLGSDPNQEFNVTNVGDSWVELQYLGSDHLIVYAGDRILPNYSSQAMTVYADEAGITALSSVTTDSRGIAAFYCPEAQFDYTVSGGGSADGTYLGAEGGWRLSESAWYSAANFPSIQAAIDALPPSGGTVFIPAGTYSLSATLYTPCDRPCHLLGESRSRDTTHGTVLQWTTNVGMLRVRGDYSSVRSLVLKNTSSTAASQENLGYGISIGRRDLVDPHPHPGTSASDTEYVKGSRAPLEGVLVEDVSILNAAGWAVHIPGVGKLSDETTNEYNRIPTSDTEAGTISFWVDFKRVQAQYSKKYGACFVGTGCTLVFFENCAFAQQGATQVPNATYYVYLGGCVQPVFERCTIEGQTPSSKEWVRMYGTEGARFDACWFENDAEIIGTTPTYFLRFTNSCRGCTINHCHFVRGTNCSGYLRLVQVESTGATGLQILSPTGRSQAQSRISGAYVDDAQIDLGGHSNLDASIVGNGVYADVSPGVLVVLPIQVTGVPRQSTLSGRALTCLGGVDFDELAAAGEAGLMARQNGNLVMNWNLGSDTSQTGCAMYFWGGAQPGWRLVNNAPSLSHDQREARAGGLPWVQGDIIYNVTRSKLQVLVGDVWNDIALTPE